MATHATNTFHLTATMKKTFIDEDGKEFVTDEKPIYALAYKKQNEEEGDLHWINRNDWVRVPLYYVDWTLTLSALFYPPICGYPAIIDDDNSNDTEFFATFKGPGVFEIRPEVTAGSKNPLSMDKLEVKITLGSLEGDKDILKGTTDAQKLHINEEGVVIGELAETDKRGTVSAELTVKVKSPPMAERIFYRKFFIVRAD